MNRVESLGEKAIKLFIENKVEWPEVISCLSKKEQKEYWELLNKEMGLED